MMREIKKQILKSSLGSEISEVKLFGLVFPGERFDQIKWQHTKSFLLKLVQKYLALRVYQRDTALQATYALQEMRSQRDSEFIGKELRHFEKKFFSQAISNPSQLYSAYRFHQEKYEWQQKRNRNETESALTSNQFLDQFYMAEKLRVHANLLTHQSMSDFTMSDPLIIAVVEHAESTFDDLPKLVQLYFLAVLSLRDRDQEEHFHRFKSFLKQEESNLDPSVIKECITMGINYCIKKLNDGNRGFVEEVFDLYQFGLENGAFLENGYISRFTYKNIVTAALGLGDFLWAESFIENYREKLEPKYRENTHRYNLAILKYKLQLYDETRELLRDVDFEDLFFNLNARLMLLKIYYESDHWSMLLSHLDSFKAFLYRHKNLGYQKKAYLNLVKYSKKILSIPPYDQKKRTILRDKLMREKIVAEKNWLLEKLEAT